MASQAQPIGVRKDDTRKANKEDKEYESTTTAAAGTSAPEAKSRLEPIEEGIEEE
jgi:hypothetical protein